MTKLFRELDDIAFLKHIELYL